MGESLTNRDRWLSFSPKLAIYIVTIIAVTIVFSNIIFHVLFISFSYSGTYYKSFSFLYVTSSLLLKEGSTGERQTHVSSLLSPTIPYPHSATGNRLRHASGPVQRVDAKILDTGFCITLPFRDIHSIYLP